MLLASAPQTTWVTVLGSVLSVVDQIPSEVLLLSGLEGWPWVRPQTNNARILKRDFLLSVIGM